MIFYIYETQAMSAVNVWHTMALQQILLPILPTNYMKEMSLRQEMSPLGKALVILHPSLERF